MASESDIRVIPNFLNSEDCRFLARSFVGNGGYGNAFWAGRLMFQPPWPEAARVAFRGVEEIVAGIVGHMVWLQNTHLVVWPDGHAGMPSHTDYGSRNEYPWREYSGTIKLNDDYEGGETLFPALNIKRDPPVGAMLFFPGGTLRHGVAPVRGGNRYMATFWFARRDRWPAKPERP